MLFLIKVHKTINRQYAQPKIMSIFAAVCYNTPDNFQTVFSVNIIVTFTD
jgi:hypothetical protein